METKHAGGTQSGGLNCTVLIKVLNFTEGEIHRKWKQSEWKCTEFIEKREGVKPISD